MNESTVAVFGATGHTGRFVVRDLLRRGIRVIAVGRDAARLQQLGFPARKATCRVAALDDNDALDRALDGAHAVINCAGPFLDTASAVIAAALRKGIHYVDVTAEQASAQATFQQFDQAARNAGIVILPAMGFFGGLADLLVTAALDEWEEADAIAIMVGLDSWHPTQGTRLTGKRNTAQRWMMAQGSLAPLPSPPAETSWDFGGSFGHQRMVEVPLSEIILIHRHVKATDVHSYLNRKALDDIRDPTTLSPTAADASGRSGQRFMLEVTARRKGVERFASASGQDIYAFSAPLVGEVVTRLLAGKFSDAGAQAPGAILEAKDVLESLMPEFLRLDIVDSRRRAAVPKSGAAVAGNVDVRSGGGTP